MRLVLIVLAAIVTLFLILLFAPMQARAQEGDNWVLNALVAQCRKDGFCYRHRRRAEYQYRPRYFQPRVYSYERREPDPRYYAPRGPDREPMCKDRLISVVGAEAYTRATAKENAEQSFMEEVRNLYGVRWLDLRNANRVTYECGRSSTGNRASEKAADAAGKYLEQCRVEAIPCRSERESADDPGEPESRNLQEPEKRRSRIFRSWGGKRQ